jgi:CHAT domain-containing protein/tetratricopeptide (TPR) repeat protein|nr:CHAT domain-containing tetratricopeptide repeat protein [uncultured Psychroserpens sp.]
MSFFRLFFICILFQYTSHSQSDDFIAIKTDTATSKSQKKILFDSLIDTHKIKSDYKLFLDDSYWLMRWYYINKNVEKAIAYNKRNISLMDSIHYQDSILYRKNIYSLGFYQSRNKNFEEAILAYSKLINYKTADEFALLAAYQLGEVHFGKHQYYIAIRYYNLSKKISENLNNNNYKILNAIGIAQSNKLLNTKKSLANGISILSSAITLTDSLNNDSDPKNNISLSHVYNLYNQRGNLYSDRDDHNFEKAKFNLEKALEIATKLNKKWRLVSSYNDIGHLYIKEKDSAAETYLKKALGFRSNKLTVSTIYRNLAQHYLEFDEFDSALENAQKSIRIFLDFDASNYNNLPSKEQLLKSKYKLSALEGIIQKSKIWIKLGENDSINSKKYFNQALNALKLADSILDFARLESKENRSKLFWQRIANKIYINATKSCFLLNKPEGAFYFIEKNKAVLLLEDVSLKMSRKQNDIPEIISKRHSNLSSIINKLEKLTKENTTDSIQSQLLIASKNYNQFIDSLDVNYRLYYKSQKPTEVIHLDYLRKKFFNNNNAYVEYILDDKNGYGIVITKEDIKLFEIHDYENLKDLAQDYRMLLEQPFSNKETVEKYNSISNELYNSLFPDAIRLLIKGKKLTIVPDYYLQNIPFEPLMTSTKDGSYLLFENEINYTYSLTFLEENSKIKRTNETNLVGFAPVNFSSQLASLPNTKEELNRIDKLFSSELFLYQQATSETFFRESKNSNIIHIASHANANDSISPWIAFHDSKIDLSELYNHSNSAELVVLSACNTSLGELHKGEGVMSLSRGFFNTGSHTVMPTLWEVNDKSSTELINSFYENIKLGQNKSLALHNAKLSYLETNSLSQSSPYYWASFVLIGDAGTLELNTNFPIIYYVIFGAILIIVLLYFFRRKK